VDTAQELAFEGASDRIRLSHQDALERLERVLNFKYGNFVIKRENRWVELTPGQLTGDENLAIQFGRLGYYRVVSVTAESRYPQDAVAIANAYADRLKRFLEDPGYAELGISVTILQRASIPD
jgi:hypothetical protein